MQIAEIIQHLESIAPSSLQESYDNSGLIVGEASMEVTGVLVSLDCIEEVIDEAIAKKCNLVVSHHPIVFSGLKRFNNANYVQRTVQKAIKHDIALYAIHTNLDNVFDQGVNHKIAQKIGLKNCQVLQPMTDRILKLVTYAPLKNADAILDTLFEAGAGRISKYEECSFSTEGTGSFKATKGSNPSVGEIDKRHYESEKRIEVVVETWQKSKVLKALIAAHPYEEVAYELYPTLNTHHTVGSGVVGSLASSMSLTNFLAYLKQTMELDVIRYTTTDKQVQTIAVCGGSGSFLLDAAKRINADVLVTADFKYHQFFDGENTLAICDIGHYESEKFTIDLLYDILTEKFSTFAVLKTGVETNPVKYYH